jgi:hypothetical protein
MDETAATGSTTYIAECYWPGVTVDRVTSASRRAADTARELTAHGRFVELRDSWLVAEDEAAFLLFEGGSVEDVRLASERAGVPFERVVAAIRIGNGER